MNGTEDREASSTSPSQPADKTGLKPSGAKRFLKAGVGSILLHAILIAVLIFCLQPTKEASPVYRVTIRPLPSPSVPEETPVKQEKKKAAKAVKQPEPAKEVKKPVFVVEDEKPVVEPIPLPVVLNKEPIQNKERAVESPPPPERKVVLLEPASSEGSGGTGKGIGEGGGKGDGLGGGTGDGLKGGDQDSGFATSGKGSGTGTGGFGRGSGRGIGDGWGEGSRGKRSNPISYETNRKPQYPSEAAAKGIEGEVELNIECLSNGKVGKVEVKKSSGHKILDQAALDGVKRWKFIPAREGKVPIDSWKPFLIEFKLE